MQLQGTTQKEDFLLNCKTCLVKEQMALSWHRWHEIVFRVNCSLRYICTNPFTLFLIIPLNEVNCVVTWE